MKKYWGHFKWWLLNIVISIDQFCNVLLGLFFWRYGFGHADETISSVLGKNRIAGNCRVCDWVCKWILNPIFPGSKHCIESIEYDEGMKVRKKNG